jgi:hypothetical protein
MDKTIKMVCVITIAWVCLSFIGGFSDSQIQQHSISHVVQKGDTLYDIADHYYLKNENGMSFNEFWYNLCQDNKYLTANRRHLQVGDVVTVNYYTVTKKQ